MIDLIGYLNLIKNYRYALSKIDAPYMPKNFPSEYPIGKDMDMFVGVDDYNKVIEITKEYFAQEGFDIKHVEIQNNFRLRLISENRLHYQIDITRSDNFVKGRVKNKNYYMVSFDTEKIIRKKEVEKNPHKLHHKEWLEKHG